MLLLVNKRRNKDETWTEIQKSVKKNTNPTRHCNRPRTAVRL